MVRESDRNIVRRNVRKGPDCSPAFATIEPAYVAEVRFSRLPVVLILEYREGEGKKER